MTFSLLQCGGTYTTKADDLSNLKSQYSQLQKQQQQLQHQLNQQNQQASAASAQKALLDKNIALIRQQVAVLDKQINDTQTELNNKSKEITTTQKRIEKNMTEYKQQVCALYEAGNESNLELLLTSKSVSQFLMRFELLKTISDHDNKVIDELKKDKANLSIEKIELKKALSSLQSSEGSLAAKRDVLSAQCAQQSALVSSLKSAASKTSQQQAAVQQKARETDAQINSEIASEAAATKRALQSQPSGGSGGSSVPHSGGVSSNYIVSFAEGLIGTPYVFGSANPRYGLDCSGLTQYVFANTAGIYLPHSAAGQAGYGTSVSRGDLQPGDLVFFATGGGGINHVGIYAGNDEFVEANSGSSTAHEVIETGLFSSGYWASRYVCARRIV